MRETRQKAEAAGRRAERRAANMLRLKGYHILAQRYVSGAGEIDLIARRGKTIVFVEVKSRADHETALHSLTPFQARRIMDGADIFMARVMGKDRDALDLSMRFDMIIVGTRSFGSSFSRRGSAAVKGGPIALFKGMWQNFWPAHIKDAWRD